MPLPTTNMSFSIMTIALLSSLGCTTCLADFGSGKEVRGNGMVLTEERSIEDYNSIEVHGAIQLEVSCSAEPSLSITGEENLLPVIETICQDGKLVISSTEPYQ